MLYGAFLTCAVQPLPLSWHPGVKSLWVQRETEPICLSGATKSKPYALSGSRRHDELEQDKGNDVMGKQDIKSKEQ